MARKARFEVSLSQDLNRNRLGRLDQLRLDTAQSRLDASKHQLQADEIRVCVEGSRIFERLLSSRNLSLESEESHGGSGGISIL